MSLAAPIYDLGSGKISGSDRSKSLNVARAVVRRIVAEQHDRPSLVSEIACEIGAEIIEGILQPEDDLNTVELSLKYNTSRTPIREALMLLEKERLVEIPPRRRPRVAYLDIQEIRDIYKARTALMEMIAVNVVLNATNSEIDDLSSLVDKMSKAAVEDDITAYVWLNVEFHDLNARIAGNETVKRLIGSLLLRTVPHRRLSLSSPNGMRQSNEDHIYLIKAYRKRDANLAAAIIRSIHFNALARLEAIYSARANAALQQG